VFSVAVKEVRQRLPAVVDDELAVAVGLENLAELRQEVREQMERDYAMASRLRLKRALLDKLAERYDFPVPVGMVDMEFDNIWAQRQSEKDKQGEDAVDGGGDEGREAPVETAAAEMAAADAAATGETSAQAAFETAGAVSAGETPPVAGETSVAASGEVPPVAGETPAVAGETPPAVADSEEAAKADYRKIAERRVRLGLVLAEIGRSNNITVTQEELNQAITREVRRHPGYERQALDFYRQNPEAVASLRAPIFEDKVVDFIVELAKAPERRVSPQELLALPELDDDNAAAGAPTEPAAEPPA